MVLPTVDPALAYVASHALTFASVVAWLVMLVQISGSRRTPESAFAWLLAFAFLPVVAIPLYLAFGSRKFPRRAKGRQLVVPPVRSGCSFELVVTGEAGGAEMLSADAEELAAAFAQAGHRCRLEIWPEQLHVFQALPKLIPEADVALERAARFLVEELAKRELHAREVAA